MQNTKKLFVVTTAVIFVSFLSNIQPFQATADESKTFIGTIESFRPAMGRPPKWYCVRLTAVADNGEKKEIWILGASGASPTSVTDFDGKPMDKPGYNHRPKVGKKVEVKYSTAKNGYDEAIFIRYVPSDYVQQPNTTLTPGKVAPQSTPQLKDTIIGRVENITAIAPGLINGWTYCKIIVNIGGSEKFTVLVTKDTKLTDAKGITNPPLPKEGEWVEVKYLNAEKGAFQATSINYLLEQQPRATQNSLIKEQ